MNIVERTNDFQKAIVDFFVEVTGLTTIYYEVINSDVIRNYPPLTSPTDRKFCKLIHNNPDGRKLCEKDHCARALNSISNHNMIPCFAGLFNQAIPIIINGDLKAVLLVGQILIDNTDYLMESDKQLKKYIYKNRENPIFCEDLEKAYLAVPKIQQYDLKKKLKYLRRLEKIITKFFEEEEAIRFSVERINHEIQTRLQALVTNTEYVQMYALKNNHEKIEEYGEKTFLSCEALDTVAQSLGDYLGEYDFQYLAIKNLIDDAYKVYKSDADYRNIGIYITDYSNGQKVKIDEKNMKYAINNLVHNAIKYSFYGSELKNRFVNIDIKVERKNLKVSFENFGIGIEKKEIDDKLLLKDGYQGVMTRGEYRTGSGKGLYFVNKIITAHKGKLEITSIPVANVHNKTNTPHINVFTVFLPIGESDE
jgi:signal transduction histidine kinase